MSTMSDLQHYIDINADTEHLGSVVLFSVEALLVQHADLMAILTKHGLSKYAPGKPTDVDVFRRTSKAQQRKRIPTTDEGVFLNLMVRDVATTDDEMLLRQIVEERVDPKGKTLAYQPVINLRFDRATATCSTHAIGMTHPSEAANDVARDVLAAYAAERGHLNADAIRTLLSRVLDGIHAVSVRPGGGCYFAAKVHNPVVQALEEIASVIPGCYLHTLPLPDTAGQREMLRRSLEDDSRGEIERTMAEVRDLLQSGSTITGAKLSSYLANFRQLKARAAEYTALLETNLSATDTALDLLQRQIAQLSTKAS